MSDTTYKSKVGYKPPVELDYHEGTPEIKSVWDNMRDSEGKILEQLEEHIVAQCSAAVGVKIDREELIKALRYDRGQYEKGYADGKRYAADEIEALQAEKKKTVTQIFGEEQQEWEEYCTGLMNRIKEIKAQLPKRGEWIKHPEVKNIYGGECIECPFCGEKYVVQYIADEKFCRNCGADMRAKMEVQE